MGLLTKLLHRDEPAEDESVVATSPCLHTALLPRWESVDDMGNEDKATAYRCDACGQEFTPAEAAQLRASEGDRLRLTTETPTSES